MSGVYDESGIGMCAGERRQVRQADASRGKFGDVPKFVELRRAASPGYRLRGPRSGGNGLFGEALLMGDEGGPEDR